MVEPVTPPVNRNPVPPAELAELLKERAAALGFELAGIAPVEPSAHAGFYQRWLARQHHGEMDYLARPDAIERRLDPQRAHPEFRSALVVGLNYYQGEGDGEGEGEASGAGIIARYALGRDYHKVIKRKLNQLLDWLEQTLGRELTAARAYVDTGPVLERELAQRAGLGWFGRNTMLIHPRRGSFFFLGVLLLDIELEYDQPFTADHCGTCNACVQACPTGALLGRDENGAPVIDATRCISYLTIEQRGPIPHELRPLIGNRIFGCDICQEVCPWNSEKFVALTREPAFRSRGETDVSSRGGAEARRLTELMRMDDDAWDAFSRGSPVRRAKRAGFLRNVAVALGNRGTTDAVPALIAALHDEEPLVRGHAAWALGRIGTEACTRALKERLRVEACEFVLDEVGRALAAAPAAVRLP